MGTITTGIGLISGIDIASLIDSILTVESAGKFRLQERIGILESQQTALLDVNARLLSFKNSASVFRLSDTFRTTLATSSDEDVLAATSTTKAQPGSYKFIVKQLVSTSQQISRGYATRDASPLGLSSLSFEFGNGRLARDRALEDLNGGDGVDRGRIKITDRSGAVGTIDLTDVTSVNEVLERINGSDDVSVTATVNGDRLEITDTSGGAGALSVADIGSDTAAADLGIAGSIVGPTLTGTSVYLLGGNSSLASLNDGNGVLVRDNSSDFTITARNNVTYDIDLGRVDLPIDDSTLLADLNNGAGVTIDDDADTTDIKFVDRDGVEHEVDLTGVTTVGELRTRIDTATGSAIQIQVETGDRFKVVDNTSGTGNLRIEGTEESGTDAAEDLGILNESGTPANEYIGTFVPSTIDQPAASTLQEVVDRINAATGGDVLASIDPDGVRLRLEDQTGQTLSNLIVASTASNPTAATDLGIETAGTGSILTGNRIIGGLDSVLTKNLNGGAGLAAATSLDFTDRSGDATNTFTFDDVSTYETLGELVTAINDRAALESTNIQVAINAAGNGLVVRDTVGGTENLVVSSIDETASLLGIEGDVAANEISGTNLQLQYVATATRLSDLNHGRGIATGGFEITDGLGQSATVTIGGDEETVQDVLDEINSRGLAITARINDNGDGIVIEENLGVGETAFVKLRVDGAGGTTASDLNLLGESATVEGASIDGSYERTVDVTASDSLDDIAAKINAAGIPIAASVVNTGSGSSPFRLNITSSITGRAGDLVIDAGGVDLGFEALSRGRDAKVFFGSDNPEDGFLITSSTNALEGVIEGVTIDLISTSDEAVTVDVEPNTDGIVAAVGQFVTNFNEVVGRIQDYDFFDTESEERGLLLGNPTVRSVRNALYRTASGPALNVSGPFKFLSQVGITFNSSGQLEFDTDAFTTALESDPAGVEALFADYDITTASEEEISPGVTITSSTTSFNSLGFGNLFENLLDDLTNSIDGTLTTADDAFSSRIDLLRGRIDLIDVRLESRRDILTRQFTAMETALAQLQSQSSSLAGFSSLGIG